MTSTKPLNPSEVTVSRDFKQRFVYCHKGNEFDSLRGKDVGIEEAKQWIEQARVELMTHYIHEMKQTHKAFSFRKAILRQDRQDVQERFVQARESL
jgi:hypothetical protein